MFDIDNYATLLFFKQLTGSANVLMTFRANTPTATTYQHLCMYIFAERCAPVLNSTVRYSVIITRRVATTEKRTQIAVVYAFIKKERKKII